ncbi:MAG: ATP-binding cassette domain-containing protein [Pseudomonadota bacterium]|nr:ATP-binding cassette domain-containing protein [Pseudomonadota bacterium]
MRKTLLEVHELVAGYEKPVVGPLSFSLSEGEVVGLFGGNGCGKSTLFRAIAQTDARIFSGRLIKAPGLRVSWQTQQPVRLDEMPLNGWDYLRYAAAGTPPPPRLKTWLNRRVDALSGGEFQLLAVWAILAGEADLVLLDEPTNNMDPKGQMALTEIIQAQRGQRAILLISHERDFLSQTCDRILEVGQ